MRPPLPGSVRLLSGKRSFVRPTTGRGRAVHTLLALRMQTRNRKRQRASETEQECQCPVCLDSFTKNDLVFAFRCCHGLCPACNEEMQTRSDLRCPTCRQPRHGVTSDEAEAAARRNAPVPEYATGTTAFMFIPSEAGFSLTNALLFGGAAEVVPMSFEPPRSAMGYGRLPWRATSRFARPSSGVGLDQRSVPQSAQQSPARQAALGSVSRALLLAQTAASALCNPEMDDEMFAATIASALAEASPPRQQQL